MVKVWAGILLSALSFALDNLGVYGNVYEIKEENILKKVFENRKLINVDIEKLIKKASQVNLNLPYAGRLSVKKFSIIYIPKQDIIINGKLIAKKGQAINVGERIKLSKVYVFLEDKMLPQFLEFSRKYPSVFLITKGNVLELQREYPHLRVYAALPVILKRLGVEKVPTIIYQSGNEFVRVELPWREGKVYIPF